MTCSGGGAGWLRRSGRLLVAAWLVVASGACSGHSKNDGPSPDPTPGPAPDPSKPCAGATCSDRACLPNTRFCKDGSVWKCDRTGDGSALERSCGSSSFCRELGDDAVCSDRACSEGEALCDGSVATICNADGSGPRPGGDDCAAADQACYRGECRNLSCVVGAKICQEDALYLCTEKGTRLALLTPCETGQFCDETIGACRPKTCEPGGTSCDGNKVRTCNELGSEWLPPNEDCDESDRRCVDGACIDTTCRPNLSYCHEGGIWKCDATGSTRTLTQTCEQDTEYCIDNSGYAYCDETECAPGEPYCWDNEVRTCSDQGRRVSTGVKCGEDEYCSSGACKAFDCTRGEYSCQGRELWVCGTYGPQRLYCPEPLSCQDLPSGPRCALPGCSPGQGACLGNQIGTCAADGNTLTTVTTDCNDSASVCGAGLACATTVTDSTDDTATARTLNNVLFGNVVDVTSARTLTQLSFNLVWAGPRDVRFVIYEWGATGFVPRLEEVVRGVTAAGFVEATGLDFPLEEGQRYLLGAIVEWQGTVVYYSEGFDRRLSFGTVVGDATGGQGYISEPYSGSAFQMRVTTRAP